VFGKASSAGIAAQIVKASLQAVGTLLFARLLGPHEIGLYAIAFPFVTFAQLFANAGLAQYLLHNSELRNGQLTALAAASFYLSLLVAGLLAIISIPASLLIGQPLIAPIISAMSIVVILESYSAFARSLAIRQHLYGFVARVDILAGFAGLVVAGFHAALSADVWVLVSQAIATPLTSCILLSVAGVGRPSFDPRAAVRLRRVLPGASGYGLWLVCFGFVNQISRNTDNVLIGWYWGAKLLGPYALAYRLLTLPLQIFNVPLSNVVLVSLGASSQSEIGLIYGRFVRLSTFLGCSTIVVMNANVSLFADELLGPGWTGLASIFHVLSFAALFQSATSLTGCLYQITNNNKALFIVMAAHALVTVIAFAASLGGGPAAVATAYSLVNALLCVPILICAARFGGISSRIYLPNCAPCLIVAILFVFAENWIDPSFFHQSVLVRLLYGVLVGGFCVIILTIVTFGTKVLSARSGSALSRAIFD
jgi:polysaccharide transporter, PST family